MKLLPSNRISFLIVVGLLNGVPAEAESHRGGHVVPIQSVLRFAGYDIGKIDGVMGEGTLQGVDDFATDYQAAFGQQVAFRNDRGELTAAFYEVFQDFMDSCYFRNSAVSPSESPWGEDIDQDTLNLCQRFARKRVSSPPVTIPNDFLEEIADLYRECGIPDMVTDFDIRVAYENALRVNRYMEYSLELHQDTLSSFRIRSVDDLWGCKSEIEINADGDLAEVPDDRRILFISEDFISTAGFHRRRFELRIDPEVREAFESFGIQLE